jgi:hypothetical protein
MKTPLLTEVFGVNESEDDRMYDRNEIETVLGKALHELGFANQDGSVVHPDSVAVKKAVVNAFVAAILKQGFKVNTRSQGQK